MGGHRSPAPPEDSMTDSDPDQAHRRSVLITGCSSGIGQVCAHGLARRGWRVIASARKAADVERLQGEGLAALQLDLDDPASIRAAVDQALGLTGGTLDALFNNGAYGLPGAVEDLTRAALRAQLETNLLGWHDLTCRVIPIMRRQGRGRIVQNSSILGLMPLPYRGAYVASKYALEGLTDTLRLELAGSGIQVSLIEPGPIASRFRENAHRAFQAQIDAEHSVHREAYRRAEARLTKAGSAQPFTLPPEAVLKRLIHALESPRPRPRYHVTFPTHLFALLRRVLSTRGMDWVITRVSAGGTR
jgi:NAD(P)-dependent dehydrogenase (short-subunit alcohol dehydrogenase family)